MLWLAELVWLVGTWSTHFPIDLDVYRLGGLAWLDGTPLYVGFTGPPLDPRLPFTYPSIAAVLFSGLSFLPQWTLTPLVVFALSQPIRPQLAVVLDKRKRLLITLPATNLAAAGRKSALTRPDPSPMSDELWIRSRGRARQVSSRPPVHEFDTCVWLTITALVVLAVRLIRRPAAYSGA